MTLAITRAGRGASIGRVPAPVIILIALLAAGIVPPFVFLAYSSTHLLDPSGGFGEFTLGHFTGIISSRAFGPTLLNSALYSFGSALLALTIGATQAWLAERTDASLRQLLYVASIISLGI